MLDAKISNLKIPKMWHLVMTTQLIFQTEDIKVNSLNIYHKIKTLSLISYLVLHPHQMDMNLKSHSKSKKLRMTIN